RAGGRSRQEPRAGVPRGPCREGEQVMSGAVTYRAARFGGCLAANAEPRAAACQVLRSPDPLQAYPKRLSDRLAHWAREAPDRTFVARRGQDGQWERITYAQMLERAQRLGQ